MSDIVEVPYKAYIVPQGAGLFAVAFGNQVHYVDVNDSSWEELNGYIYMRARNLPTLTWLRFPGETEVIRNLLRDVRSCVPVTVMDGKLFWSTCSTSGASIYWHPILGRWDWASMPDGIYTMPYSPEGQSLPVKVIVVKEWIVMLAGDQEASVSKCDYRKAGVLKADFAFTIEEHVQNAISNLREPVKLG